MHEVAVEKATYVLAGRDDLFASLTNLAGSMQFIVLRIEAIELCVLEPPLLNLLLADVVDLGRPGRRLPSPLCLIQIQELFFTVLRRE